MLQESVDPPFPRLVVAHRLHQLGRRLTDPAAHRLTRIRQHPQLVDERLLVGEVAGIDIGNRARAGKRLPGEKHGYTRVLVSLV